MTAILISAEPRTPEEWQRRIRQYEESRAPLMRMRERVYALLNYPLVFVMNADGTVASMEAQRFTDDEAATLKLIDEMDAALRKECGLP